MIIEIPDGNSIIKWKYNDTDEWKSAEIVDLIKAYEGRPQGEFEITNDDIQLAIKTGFNDGYAMAKAKFERPMCEWVGGDKVVYHGNLAVSGDRHCSNCGALAGVEDNFCGRCGAEMREADNEN